MAAATTLTELRKMRPEDLLKEIRTQENSVVKLRLGVKLGKEKDSAKYIREKKQLARMKTVLTEKAIELEKEEAKPAEVKKEEKVEEKKEDKKEKKPAKKSLLRKKS